MRLTIALAIASLMLFTACAKKDGDASSKCVELHDIVRVLRNHQCSYDLFMKQSGTNALKEAHLYRPDVCDGTNTPIIIVDVPDDQLSWARYLPVDSKRYGNSTLEFETLEIHIHAPQEIGGGTWYYGKGGSSPVHVIE